MTNHKVYNNTPPGYGDVWLNTRKFSLEAEFPVSVSPIFMEDGNWWVTRPDGSIAGPYGSQLTAIMIKRRYYDGAA